MNISVTIPLYNKEKGGKNIIHPYLSYTNQYMK